MPDFIGGCARIRTLDPLIKSQQRTRIHPSKEHCSSVVRPGAYIAGGRSWVQSELTKRKMTLSS